MISLIPKTKNLIAYAGVALFFCVVSCATKGNRVGAVCEDGWKSNATGSGACSHHGGVDYWIYE